MGDLLPATALQLPGAAAGDRLLRATPRPPRAWREEIGGSAMIRPSVVLAGWGVMLALLALVLALFSPPQFDWAFLAGAALALAPLGIVTLGLAAGPWLAGIGVEVLAVGLFLLVRELRAQRRARGR